MPAAAQNGTQISIEQARKLIRQEKTEIESNYKEQEAQCLKKFIATPCIEAAKKQKAKSLVTVKQRELVLNDEERALKKAKIESNQTQPSSKQPIQAPDTEMNNDKLSIDSQEQKQQQKQSQAQEQAQAQAKLMAQRAEMKKVESAKKANRRIEKSKQEGANVAKYQSKVSSAQSRKQAKDDRDANRSKPKAAPLPAPSNATSTSTATSPTLK